MGYAHIDNLYKNQNILLFRECYAMEKVHGTSAHVKFERLRTNPLEEAVGVYDCKLTFFSGGASHIQFIELFNAEDLKKRFLELGPEDMTVYGEAYGGRMQGMKATYGDKLLFIAFDVKIGDRFLNVDSADMMVQKLGLEFVPYKRVSTDLAVLDAERDAPSEVAVRRGITTPQIREGVVLRPVVELVFPTGMGRVVAKHKRPEFSERASKKDTTVDPGKLEVLTKASAIADEWVTPTRMEHVLDKLRGTLQREPVTEDTRAVIDAMIEDVTREAKDEIVASKEAIKAISSAAAKLFKQVQIRHLEAQFAPSPASLTEQTLAVQPLSAELKVKTYDEPAV